MAAGAAIDEDGDGAAADESGGATPATITLHINTTNSSGSSSGSQQPYRPI